MRSLTSATPLFLLAVLSFSRVDAVTVEELPKLDGNVFAAQLGVDEQVAVLVFAEGGKFYEYRFDPETRKLSQSAEGQVQELTGAPNYSWRAQTEEGSECTQFAYATGTLSVKSGSTGLVKVDYSNPSQEIPVLDLSGFPACYVACMHGCCPCCFCVHRALGIPTCMDWLCCRWNGQIC